MSLKLQRLIDEATRLGNNIHRHVARRLWGTANVTTIHDAKRLVYSHLYGQESDAYKSAVFGQPTLRQFQVKVFTDADLTPDYAIYTVTAVNELDARIIAFLLDGGCASGLTDFDAGHVELVKEWTEVIE